MIADEFTELSASLDVDAVRRSDVTVDVRDDAVEVRGSVRYRVVTEPTPLGLGSRAHTAPSATRRARTSRRSAAGGVPGAASAWTVGRAG